MTIEPGETDWEIHVNYKSVLATAAGYIKPRVKIELSSRNETEPSQQTKLLPYLAQQTTGLIYPEPLVDALVAERTFWEKVTLIHAELSAGRLEETADRMSRHWSDIIVLSKVEAGERALNDAELCMRVVNHKDKFWRDGKANYDACRNKQFLLVPAGKALQVLEADYKAMIDAGMFFGESPQNFDDMLKDLTVLQVRINS